MIDETIRSKLYDQVEKQYPIRPAEIQRKPLTTSLVRAPAVDLSVQWQRQVFALKEQVLTAILFQLHTLFELAGNDADIKRQAREALHALFERDQACRRNGDCDVYAYAHFLFRRQWHAASASRSMASASLMASEQPGPTAASPPAAPSLLAALRHLERAGFFQKSRQEIAGWTRRFLFIERYHRLDAIEHENRLDRYRLLRAQIASGKEPIRALEDLVLWLEFRMIEEAGLSLENVGPLSRRLAQELGGCVGPDLLEGAALQPALYVLLKCHQYCLAETLGPLEQRRLERLSAARQLDSVLDLMRVVINRTMGEQSIPQAGALLDRLQAEGFNIEHQGFRDPYEASLVTLDEVERMEATRLPLFLPLEDLSGEFASDLALSQEMLLESHNRIIRGIVGECEAYLEAADQPLPKNHLIARLVRFATGWTLAGHPWLPPKQPEKLEEQVRQALADSVIRQLVRPRKGYELKSRNELKQLIAREVQTQLDALERIAHSRTIQGHHDYVQFTRYVAFQQLRSECGGELTAQLREAAATMAARAKPEWVAEISRKWGLNFQQVHPHALEAVEDYCRSVIPARDILPLLQQHFETTENDLQEVYDDTIKDFSSAFYTLLVGYGRHREELQRLKASRELIGKTVHLLAPPLETIHQTTLGSLKEKLSNNGASLYRSSLQPYLLAASEWKAYLAWQAHQRIGHEVEVFLNDGDLDGLLTELENGAAGVELPPQTLTHQSVQATLIELLKPEEKSSAVTEELVQEIVQMLPRMDCAACGQASCNLFARALLAGRSQPNQCVQLPKQGLAPLLSRLQQLREAAGDGRQPDNMLQLLADQHRWRSSPEKLQFQKVISVRSQKSRRLFMVRLQEIWENFAGKPQIYKDPDLEEFHQNLRAYMGDDAVERLREEERNYLVEHGDERVKAEWQLLKERQNWLNLANRRRQSRPLLQRKDPSWTAAQVYENVFVLHQLSARDRRLVLRYRLETHQDGFSQWWNEDLLSMNLPDFFIRDWEDFSKIIKNAYWHQESSLSAGQLLAKLKGEVLPAATAARIGDALLSHWLDAEHAAARKRQSRLAAFRSQTNGHLITTLEELRELIGALVDECHLAGAGAGTLSPATAALPVSAEEQLTVAGDRIWRQFQNENYRFAADFSCTWEQLRTAEKEALKGLPAAGPNGAAGGGQGASGWYLKDWQEPLHKRVALIQALIAAGVKEARREELEYRWFAEKAPVSSAAFIKLRIRRALREGKGRAEIETELHDLLQANPKLHERLVEYALIKIILKCQVDSLQRGSQFPRLGEDLGAELNAVAAAGESNSSAPPEQGPAALQEQDVLVKALPELKSIIDLLIERHKTMDRERLLHYLFLLAKMEGNLDSLTALLREIRETSDIMEAAWLRFTEERILEGPGQKSLPGTALGIALLVSRLKDKEAANRGLREGVSRKEKKNIAAAVNELVNFIRYHVLLAAERGGNLQSCIADVHNAGYDLSSVDREALDLAIQRQWERREQLTGQKIWIYTTVTARRLAAQDQELQEAEREFYAIRTDILKGEASGDEHYHETASRRGVALGRIKEEMYRQLSDLLEKERIATFQKRIEQIVDELDKKRAEIYEGWLQGSIDRRTVFYALRQYQKRDASPSWGDCQRFLRDHWFTPLEELRSAQRPDRGERIRELNARLQALLGVSPLELEAEAERLAEQDFDGWMIGQLSSLQSRI